MLSPDPVTQAPENGQNYDRYTYAFNNPLKYTDPSGFVSLGCALLGCGVTFDFGNSGGGSDSLSKGSPYPGFAWPSGRGGGNSGANDFGGIKNDLDYADRQAEATGFYPDGTPASDGCTGGLSLGGICGGYDIPNYLDSPEFRDGDQQTINGDIVELTDSESRIVLEGIFGADNPNLPNSLNSLHRELAGKLLIAAAALQSEDLDLDIIDRVISAIGMLPAPRIFTIVESAAGEAFVHSYTTGLRQARQRQREADYVRSTIEGLADGLRTSLSAAYKADLVYANL